MEVLGLGTARSENEGLRIGTVRKPLRGVRKDEYSSQNWYYVWLPDIAPSPELMKLGKSANVFPSSR